MNSKNLANQIEEFKKQLSDGFIQTFHWFCHLLRGYTSEISAEQFWQMVAEQIAYLSNTDLLRFKIIWEDASIGTWKKISRNAIDNNIQVIDLDRFSLLTHEEKINFESPMYYKIFQSERYTELLVNEVTFEISLIPLRTGMVFIQWISNACCLNGNKAKYFGLIHALIKEFTRHQNWIENERRKKEKSRIERPLNNNEITSEIEYYRKFKDLFFIDFFGILKLRIYSIFSQFMSESSDAEWERFSLLNPFSVFILKAIYMNEENQNPHFLYIFDEEQLRALERENISIEDIQYLGKPDMMEPNQGLCGKVAETKLFQYTMNWQNYTKKIESKRTYNFEKQFLKRFHLYEWPIVDYSGKVVYIVCINYGDKIEEKMSQVKPLDPKVLLKIDQIIKEEFQKNLDYINSIDEIFKKEKFLNEADYKLRVIKGIYHHSFKQRYITPVNILLNELNNLLRQSENGNWNICHISKVKDLNESIEFRIKMFENAIEAIDKDVEDYINSSVVEVDLCELLRTKIPRLLELNLKERERQVGGAIPYSNLKLKLRIMEGSIRIRCNYDAIEGAIYQIIDNSISRNVFEDEWFAYKKEKCIIELGAETQKIDKKDWLVITIKNNGKKMGNRIKDVLSEMFADFKDSKKGEDDSIYIRRIRRFGDGAGTHTGTGLLYATKVISSITNNLQKGYIELCTQKNNTQNWTIFSIYLPFKKNEMEKST